MLVCLQFHFAAIAADQALPPQRAGFHHIAALGQEPQQRGDGLVGVLLAVLAGRMFGGDVGNFVGQHRRQLGFTGHVGDQAAVDIHIAPRGGEGVDVRAVDHGKGELIVGPVRYPGYPLTHLDHIVHQFLVFVNGHFGDDLVVHLLADLGLFFGGHGGGRRVGKTQRHEQQAARQTSDFRLPTGQKQSEFVPVGYFGHLQPLTHHQKNWPVDCPCLHRLRIAPGR